MTDKLYSKLHYSKLIWFLPSMCIEMELKITLLRKSYFGIVTMIWLLPSVNLHMSLKIASLRKSLITMGTLVCFSPVCRCKNNINKNSVYLFLYANLGGTPWSSLVLNVKALLQWGH